MKWTTHQLNEFRSNTMKFEDTIRFDEEVKEIEDIVKMGNVDVTGTYRMLGDKYIFEINIKTKLTMECAVTLQEVVVPLEIEVEERFSDSEDDNEIEGITIDLTNYIWLNILAAKPMRVVAKGVVSPFEEKEPEKKPNPQFEALKKFL